MIAPAFELVQTAPPVRPASAFTRPDVFMYAITMSESP